MVFFLVIGVLYLFRPVIEWGVKLGNTIGGRKTEITKGTIIAARIGAIAAILFGLFFYLYI